jgi:transposase
MAPGAGSRAVPDDLVGARQRIAELERKIGQQQLELDFFHRALRQVSGPSQASDRPGATPSTRSSKQ